MTKFLIFGLGSIGQRHVRMIKKATNGEALIGAYRSRNLDLIITDDLKAKGGKSLDEYYGLKSFYDLNQAFAWNPDAVFVTNPISFHIDTATLAAEHGAHLFIEKPLGHNLEGTDRLLQLVRTKNLSCMIGYQLRYHPAFAYIQELIKNRSIGKLISADLHFGEYLPGMHPYEDYRDSHASRSEQGGGVILCLSHMVDIAFWLFGFPVSVFAKGGHLSSLDMDVEDTADLTLGCIDSGREFPVHIHLDFLQKPARNYTHIVGENGSILFNYCENLLSINMIGSEPKLISYTEFERNDMFLEEIKDFISSIEMGTSPPIPLEHGIEVLRVCMAAKKSLQNGQVEVLK